jgi:hypothetical protein
LFKFAFIENNILAASHESLVSRVRSVSKSPVPDLMMNFAPLGNAGLTGEKRKNLALHHYQLCACLRFFLRLY